MSNNVLRSRQLNPCDHYFWKSRGYTERPYNWKALLNDMEYYKRDSYSKSIEDSASTSSADNLLRSRQLNPFDDLFWKNRGYTRRPRNWQDLLKDMGYYVDSNVGCSCRKMKSTTTIMTTVFVFSGKSYTITHNNGVTTQTWTNM